LRRSRLGDVTLVVSLRVHNNDAVGIGIGVYRKLLMLKELSKLSNCARIETEMETLRRTKWLSGSGICAGFSVSGVGDQFPLRHSL